MKKKRRTQIKHLLSAFFVALFFSSCQWVTIEPVAPEIPDNVSFSTDIQPIFTNNCITCHSSRNPVLTAGSAYANLTNGGYINTNNPASSGLYVKVTSGHPGGNATTSPTQNALILSWIEAGAQNN